MATGRRAFEGKSQVSLIAAIIEREPTPPSQLVPLLPPALDRVVQQCMAKDPDERIQAAHDVKLELRWLASASSQAGVPAPLARRGHRERLVWAVAGALALAVVALGSLELRSGRPPQVIRFEVGRPRGTTRLSWPRLSPDGRLLAFLAMDSTGAQHIWVRPLDAVEAHPLEAVVGAARPFWSPDTRWLAVINDGKLLKIPVTGGPTIGICDAPGGWDGTWGRDGWILFDGGATDSIRGVPASGGTPRAITFLDRSHGETGHSWPFFLPDGRRFLFVSSSAGAASEIRIGRLGSRESRPVGRTDSRAEYTPPGYLVYENAGVLVAQRFDPGTARVRGDAIALGDITAGSSGAFSVSSAGTLAFRPRAAPGSSRLLWVDRNGHASGEAAPPGRYEDVVLSPDGMRVALSIVSEQPSQRDIWVRDLHRGVSSRLTFDPGDEFAPAWLPDGNRIVYGAARRGAIHCYIRSAWGGGAEDSLGGSPGFYEGPFGWSGAANVITIAHVTVMNHWDVWVLSPEGRQSPRPLLVSPFSTWAAQLSPDGRWLAYTSNETGRNEVYVVPYPGPGPKIQISTSGGQAPLWRADGKELFFQGMDQTILVVDVHAGAIFEVGAPKALFTIAMAAPGPYRGYRWAPSPDGQRFIINASSSDVAAGRFTVVSNWTQELHGR